MSFEEKNNNQLHILQSSYFQVLSRANIEMVLKFALEKKLFVFADEVS